MTGFEVSWWLIITYIISTLALNAKQNCSIKMFKILFYYYCIIMDISGGKKGLKLMVMSYYINIFFKINYLGNLAKSDTIYTTFN